MRKLIVFIFILFISTCCVESIKSKYYSVNVSDAVVVVKIIDGDTIDVTNDGKIERIRLVGVDTPEPYSNNNESKWYGLPNTHLKKWGINAMDYTYKRLYKNEAVGHNSFCPHPNRS